MITLANPAAAFAAGAQYAQQIRAAKQQNALLDLYQTQGAGIASGEQGAINALAALDPNAAMGARQNALSAEAAQLGMAATRQSMAFKDEEMDMLRNEAKAAAAAEAAKMSEQERAAEIAQMESVLSGAAALIDDRPQFEAFLQSQGMDPAQIPPGMERAFIAMTEGGRDALKELAPAPIEPLSAQAKFEQDKRNGLIPPDAAFDSGATTINMGGGSDKQVFDLMAESAKSAQAAATGLSALQEAEKAAGGAITGFGADTRLQLAKVASLLGADPSAVVDTETFRAAIAPQVAAMMKATVGSTQISNADREFAERAAGGSITLDAASIKRLMTVMRKAGEVVLSSHMERLDKVYPDNGQFARERALFAVAPTAAPPQADASSAAGSAASLDDLASDERAVWELYSKNGLGEAQDEQRGQK